ncbi:MAG: hypothetical protein JW909_01245 [Planctomycetes bacterium]|nr:hypothetical protein [Planctomycetota bacterium]
MTTRKELFELDLPGDEQDLPSVQGDAPPDSGSGTLPPGTMIFSVEQLTVLAVAVLILVVIAFLVGAYVSGSVERSAGPVSPPEIRVAENSDDLLPDQRGEPPLPETYEEPLPEPQASPSASPAGGTGNYTLEVIRFILDDRAVAVMTQERLQRYGYAPVFLQADAGEISVCVGRFDTRQDAKGLLWKDEIRNLRGAYRHCDFVPVKSGD